MSRSLRRGAAAALVLAAIVPLSACAAGNDADTLEIKPDNAATSIGTAVKLNNIVVVTTPGSAGEYSGAATVTVNIANTTSQEEVLTSVKIGDATATLTGKDGAPITELRIGPNQSVLLGGPLGDATAQVTDARLSVGGYAPTSFGFKNSGSVNAQANVQPASDLYKGFGPKDPAKASASPSAGASASASAGASASPSAGATASGSPSAPAGTASPSASAR